MEHDADATDVESEDEEEEEDPDTEIVKLEIGNRKSETGNRKSFKRPFARHTWLCLPS